MTDDDGRRDREERLAELREQLLDDPELFEQLIGRFQMLAAIAITPVESLYVFNRLGMVRVVDLPDDARMGNSTIVIPRELWQGLMLARRACMVTMGADIDAEQVVSDYKAYTDGVEDSAVAHMNELFGRIREGREDDI